MTWRNSSKTLMFGAMVGGFAIGVAADRGSHYLSAQSAAPARAERPQVIAAVTQDALYDQLARQYEQFQHVNRTFELVARTVAPSVVHIVAQKTSRKEESPRINHFEETGSGVIVRGDKGTALYVLTNNHVVADAAPAKISIFLQDGRALHPERYWLDAAADIAVLKLNREDLPAARLGNSEEMAVGNWVLALGSPFGLTHSVSQGIISARGRHMSELEDVENQDFLQTDAAINPGNSGGPLVNLKGEVIGINNSIASSGGGNEGVGFSIPINLARWIMNELITHGQVSRGGLGIFLHAEFRPDDAKTLGLERPRGAWIDAVDPASPAAQAGLHDNDVILTYKGIEVQDLNHLINMVSMSAIGQPANLTVWRGGKAIDLTVKVGTRERKTAPGNAPADAGKGQGLLRRPGRPEPGPLFAQGLELATLDEESARRLNLPDGLRGAAVLKIDPQSPFAPYLKPLDVISAVAGRAVRSAEEAVKALNERTDRNPIEIGFDRVARGVIERRTARVP
ncbi:MAG: trypsin-like peptidase domain-containing protein [Isosphaeraceae bacterium]|nr:trypsin-like peptidase domain-containing protein [Isosphaeraceae bacterium]